MVYPFQLLEHTFYHNALGVAVSVMKGGGERGRRVCGVGLGGLCWRKFIDIETVISFLMKNDLIHYPKYRLD